MRNFELYQLSFFEQSFQEIRKMGFPLDSFMNRTELKHFDLSNPFNYVPSSSIFSLFKGLVQSIGYEELMNSIVKEVHLNKIRNYGNLILAAPTLYNAILKGVQIHTQIYTQQRVFVKIIGNKVYYNFFKKHKNQHEGHDLSEILHLSYIISVYKYFLGHQAAPLEIHLTQKRKNDYSSMAQYLSAPHLQLGAKNAMVVFPTCLLGSDNGLMNKSDSNSIDYSTNRKVELLLNSLNVEALPTLEKIASFLDISRSSIQHQLAKENTNYQLILDKWRFQKSISYLTKTTLTLQEISELLYYSDKSNFIRAFKRWSQTTPSEFRTLV